MAEFRIENGVEYPVYKNNPRLKAPGVKIPFEPWQVEELIKCASDPIYFIEKYVKIVHIDKGLVPFKLYDYQKDIVKLTTDNRFILLKLPRQSGKCWDYKTLINIRNKQTKEITSISLGDFYEWQRFREQARRILEKHSIST